MDYSWSLISYAKIINITGYGLNKVAESGAS